MALGDLTALPRPATKAMPLQHAGIRERNLDAGEALELR
jgi:hypothetical protein